MRIVLDALRMVLTPTEPPRFAIDQAVLVDEGLPGEIMAVKRGVVPGILGLPPLDTWLYTSGRKLAATYRSMSRSTTWLSSRPNS